MRGHEGFYTDLAATRKFLDKGRDGVLPKGALQRRMLTEAECAHLPEVCLCLIGKFKGETGERHFSIVLANESSSGLKIRWWIEKLVEVCEIEGKTSGYAFGDESCSAELSPEYACPSISERNTAHGTRLI